MTKKESFLTKRIKGVGYAYKGAKLLLKNEASIKVQFAIALLTTVAGFFFHISSTEWMLQLLAIALVMGLEGMNSAIEELADFVHPDRHPKIGLVKDIAAGAVFFAAVFAISIGLIIYIPKIF